MGEVRVGKAGPRKDLAFRKDQFYVLLRNRRLRSLQSGIPSLENLLAFVEAPGFDSEGGWGQWSQEKGSICRVLYAAARPLKQEWDYL